MRKLKLTIYLSNNEPDRTIEDLGSIISQTLSKYVMSVMSGDPIEVDGVSPGCGCKVISAQLVEDGIYHICLGDLEFQQHAN